MSWQAVKAAQRHRLGNPAYKSVLFVIAEHAHEDGTGATPSIECIAEASDACERTVRRAIKAMVGAGVLTPGRWGGRQGWTVAMQPVPESTKPDCGTAKPDSQSIPKVDSQSIKPDSQSKKADCGTAPSEPPVTTKNHQPPLPPVGANGHDHAPAGREAFDAFWRAYPRRIGKRAAEKAWTAALKRGANPERIIAAAVRYRDDPARKPDFTKYPQGWLNEARYDDEPAEAQPALVYTGTTRYDD